jgi:hypothetical protein
MGQSRRELALQAKGVAFGVAFFCATPRAAAEDALELSWKAPAECPQEEAFKQEVEHFLGQGLESRRDQEIVILAVATRNDEKAFSVRLNIATAAGIQRRVLTHEDCAELTEAAALVAALAIDPTLTAKAPAAPPQPVEEAPPPAAPAEEPTPAPEPSPIAPPPAPPQQEESKIPNDDSTDIRLSLGLLGFIGVGALPEAGPGAAADIAVDTGPLRFVARGSYWFPRFAAVEGASGPGVDVDLWSAGARACWISRWDRVELASCLGPELGDLRGTGVDVENSRTRHARVSALMVGASLAYQPRPGTRALLGFELGKTLESPPFGIVVDGRPVTAFEPEPWIARVLLGLGVL